MQALIKDVLNSLGSEALCGFTFHCQVFSVSALRINHPDPGRSML